MSCSKKLSALINGLYVKKCEYSLLRNMDNLSPSRRQK